MDDPARGVQRPLSQRIAALLALLALVVAGLLSAWWIVTDRVELPSRSGSTEEAAPTP